VFIHQSNWNANPDFTIQVVDSEWVNIPEAVHMQGDNLSFADGHCEHWTWFERHTLQLQQTIYTQTAGGTSTTIWLAGSLNVVPGDKDFARVAGAYSTPLSGRGEF
jgi:hypothetical protein